jgi:Glycosyl transferase family 2
LRTLCSALSRRTTYTRRVITVVIPHIEVAGAHSRGDMLQQAIDSVYAQTANELVHDPIIITDYARRGPAWAVAQGVALVTTQWVTLLGDDDLLMPRHHEVLLRAAEQTGADVVYGDLNIIDEVGTTTREGVWDMAFDEAKLRVGNYIPGGGSLMRTALLQHVGVPQDDSVYAREMAVYEDWAMYIALLDGGAKFHNVPDILYCMRRWGGGGQGRNYRRDGTIG